MSSLFRDVLSIGSDLVSTVADVVQNKTELEKRLDEALSKANWSTPKSSLREIAAATNYHQDFVVIMRAVWEALNVSMKTWRQIYKGLELLEVLIKSGSERCVDDARDHIFRVRSLTDFSHMENGRDQGAGIREIAKRLVELLNDTERLREERKKSKELSAKLVGISNDGVPSAASFRPEPSFGSNDFGSGSSNNEWGRSGRSQDDMHYGSSTRNTGGGRGSRASSIVDEVDQNGFDNKNSKSAVSAAQRHNELANASAARRGRRPGGGTTHTTTTNNSSTDDFDNFGSAPVATKKTNNNDTHFDDFDSFTSAPAVASTSSTAARMNTALPKTTTNANVPKLSGPGGNTASNTSTDSFDPFKSSSFSSGPAPAPAPMDDFFSTPVSAPVKPAVTNPNGMLDLFGTAPNTAVKPVSTITVPVSSVAFDPFAVPAPAPATVTAPQQTVNNPFANMNFGGLSVASNATHNNNDGFGAFTTGPKDDDVDRLVALDRLSLGDMNKANSSPSGNRNNAPLKTLAQTAKPTTMTYGSPMAPATTNTMGGGINISSISAMSPTLLGGPVNGNNNNNMTGFMPNNTQPRPMNPSMGMGMNNGVPMTMGMNMNMNTMGMGMGIPQQQPQMMMNNNPFGNMGMGGMTIPPVTGGQQQPRPMGGLMMPPNNQASNSNNAKDPFNNLNFF